MDEATLVSYILQYARREVVGGKGRLFLPDFLEVLPNPKPSANEILSAWRKAYPKIPIFQATENVILVYIGDNACV